MRPFRPFGGRRPQNLNRFLYGTTRNPHRPQKAWRRRVDDEGRQRAYPYDPQRAVVPSAPLMRTTGPLSETEALMMTRPGEDIHPIVGRLTREEELLHLAMGTLNEEEADVMNLLRWEQRSIATLSRMRGTSERAALNLWRRVARKLGLFMVPTLHHWDGDSSKYEHWVAEREWIDGRPRPATRDERKAENVSRGDRWAPEAMKQEPRIA